MSDRLLPIGACVLLLVGCAPPAAGPRNVAKPADDTEDRAAKAIEDEAVRALENRGYKVVRDENDPAKPVIEVSLSNGGSDADENLRKVATLKGLQTLDLSVSGVTNAGLKELAPLQRLKTLKIGDGGHRVSDAGMKDVAALKGLENLDLHHNLDLTDASVKELVGLSKLQSLDISGTRVSDAGLKNIASLKRLKSLNLHFLANVTDEGVKELTALKDLQTLDLGGIGMTDAGLKYLTELPQLQTLTLSSTYQFVFTGRGFKEGTGLTDAGLIGVGQHQESANAESRLRSDGRTFGRVTRSRVAPRA
jgi:internalin A